MNLFDVYSLFDVTPVRARGCKVWDSNGQEYLDLYGGHAVISVGHSHPDYVAALKDQLDKIGFYSNSVVNPLQQELAQRLGKASGYEDYSLFLDNSGAESNENAAKLASFHTGKDRIIAFGVEEILKGGDVAGVIIEGIQGCGGINVPDNGFMQELSALCKRYGACLILDEVQSGYGRTGRFFAHQWNGIRPDIITMGKGIANGFPCGGILISPEFKAVKGMLGTTFGGNYLAMAAALSVLDIMEREHLTENALKVGEHLKNSIPQSPRIKEVRGRGLMLGIEMNEEVAPLRKALLFDKHIFTGVSGKNMVRLLAPLCLSIEEADRFIEALKELL